MKARKPVVLLEIFYTDQNYSTSITNGSTCTKIEPNSLSQTGKIHGIKS